MVPPVPWPSPTALLLPTYVRTKYVIRCRQKFLYSKTFPLNIQGQNLLTFNFLFTFVFLQNRCKYYMHCLAKTWLHAFILTPVSLNKKCIWFFFRTEQMGKNPLRLSHHKVKSNEVIPKYLVKVVLNLNVFVDYGSFCFLSRSWAWFLKNPASTYCGYWPKYTYNYILGQ